MKKDCIFCKIVANEIPSNKVYENADVLAFLSTGPVNPGHTLLVAKKHSENIYATEDATLAAIGIALKTVSSKIKKALNADGINIQMNNDPVAGQVIFHAHFHIIPRFEGDGFTHWKEGTGYKDREAQDIAEKIRKTDI